jgi:hypothetical protein
VSVLRLEAGEPAYLQCRAQFDTARTTAGAISNAGPEPPPAKRVEPRQTPAQSMPPIASVMPRRGNRRFDLNGEGPLRGGPFIFAATAPALGDIRRNPSCFIAVPTCDDGSIASVSPYPPYLSCCVTGRASIPVSIPEATARTFAECAILFPNT